MTTTAPTSARTTRSPYENWRPPIVGVTVLAPVGASSLLVADMTGHGYFVLPHGTVEDGQTPEQAAHRVLTGPSGGTPIQRRVGVVSSQARRRKITTHLVMTAPLSLTDAGRLSYRDPRGELRVLPTPVAIAALPSRASEWALLGLQSLAVGVVSYLEDGVVQRLEAVAKP